MSEDGRDLVERIHREAVERYREEDRKGRELVEAMFREALERKRQQQAEGQALVEQVHREAIEQARVQPPPPGERPTGTHYTQLAEAQHGEPLAEEWNTYRRAVGHWLAQGLEGRHVLIKRADIIGIYGTSDEAMEEGLKRYLGQPFFVHLIRTEEPYLRIRGINYPWLNLRFR